MLSPTLTVAAKNSGRKQRGGESYPPREGGFVGGGSSNTLMYAAQQGNVERVRQLIRKERPLLFENDRSGKTPLHYCCTSDNKRAVLVADYLVMAAPELVEGKDEDGFTPLHLAVIAGNMPLVTFLLANNADVNAVDNEKHTVVHWAAVCGETEALRAVLAAGAQVSTPDVHKGFPLHYAAQMCGGNDKDASLGYQVLQVLLTHSDINVKVEDGDGRQPLLWAASAGSAKAVLALIKAGSPVEAADKDGLTALHCAASRGHTDCIDTLLTLCGASPDVIDSNGCTALHYAVTLGHADATALLLAHGSDPNRQDRKGRSPAHCGCSKGQFETVKMIGAHGANLWLKNARGDLPLHEAAASGRRDLVKWLLATRPSQVNARNNDGRCPLHLAALNDNADMCKILLDAGAQINPVLRTSKNAFMTPLDCALRRGFRSTAKYLQLHGGVPATRLGSGQHQNVNSAVSLQIRDDITFWGDTSSDSERENGEFNKHIKSQKKKLAQKYERKRASASGSDLDEKMTGKLDKSRTSRKYSEKSRFSRPKVRTDSASSSYDPTFVPKKSSKNRFDYSNEITINGNTEINIHQTREISVGRETSDLSSVKESPKKLTTSHHLKVEPTSEKEKHLRPKSAKHGIKSKSNKSDSERSSTAKSSASPSSINIRKEDQKKFKDRKLKDQGTNTAEELSKSVPVVEQFDDLPPRDQVSSDTHKQFKMPDEYSRISDTSEDQEKQENIIVEASVHEPPKHSTHESETILENSECQPINSEGQVPPGEIDEKENITATSELQAVKDETKKDEDLEKNEPLHSQESVVPVTAQDGENLGTDSAGLDIQPEMKDVISERILPVAEGMKNGKDMETNEKKDEENKISGIDDAKETNIEGMSEEIAGEQTEENIKNLKRILSHETFLHNQEQMEENTQMKEAAKEVANAAIGMININIQQELSLKLHEDEQKKESENSEGSDFGKTQKSRSEDTSQSTTDILDSANITVREVSEDQLADSTRNDEERWNGMKEVEEGTMKKAFGEMISDDSSSTAEKKVKKFTKIPKQDIKAKDTISIMKTPTPTGDSTTSSVTDVNKTHKSFTVLEERVAIEKNKKRERKRGSARSELKKQRSKSEETKGNKEKFVSKPSKIPTALGKTILSKSDRNLNEVCDEKSALLNQRVPSLPELDDAKSRIREQYRSQSNISTRRAVSIFSDEKGSGSEDVEEDRRISSRRRRTKRRSQRRDSRSAGSDYESSNVIDSGFEPSPRSTRVPRWKNVSERGVNMTSVTQSIQSNIRRYHLERKIFQHLLDLKRMQIRSGQHNESMLVKRAIDAYHNSCASTVGAGRYIPNDLTFRAFEKFLYDSLRKLQKNGAEYLKGLPEAPSNPLLCTRSTHRCMHATHAYTGVPCAAYLPKLDHHTIPKIGFNSCKPGTGGFLPNINPKKAVTLELCHGNDKQVISLPADRLDQNKRYYVTFTVKGNEPQTPTNETPDGQQPAAHRHSRSD